MHDLRMRAPTLLLIALSVFAGVRATSAQTRQPWKLAQQAIAPEIHALTNEALIEELREESAPANPGSSFFPLELRNIFQPDKAPGPNSAVRTEIVRRGVAILPDLLTHLTDARSTKWVVRRADNTVMINEGSYWFSDTCDYRFSDPSLQPTGVNLVRREELLGRHPSSGKREPAPEIPPGYTLKVGDLCYAALGQIVNRSSGRSTSWVRDTVISSPVIFPALAAAVRADWAGLTAEAHRRSLVFDINRSRDSLPEWLNTLQALVRLLYYYPETGQDVCRQLLSRALIVENPGAQASDLIKNFPGIQAMSREAFRGQFDSPHAQAVFDALLDEKQRCERMDDDQAQQRGKIVTSILTQFPSDFSASNVRQKSYMQIDSQSFLLTTLSVVESDELDQLVGKLYDQTIQLAVATSDDRLRRDGFALTCAKRIAGRDSFRDDSFRTFFTAEIAALRSDPKLHGDHQTRAFVSFLEGMDRRPPTATKSLPP